MNPPKNKLADRVFPRIAPLILSAAAFLLVFFFVVQIKDTSKQNNGYIRVINCVISTPAKIRTQEDIEHCYKTVESDLGIKLQRYDTSEYK